MDKLDLETQGHQWTFFIHPNARDRYQPTRQTPSDSETISDDTELQSTQGLDYISNKDR